MHDIKALLVKVLIYLVSGGSRTDLFEVCWESGSAHFLCLARQSRARICATQSLNWRLGCNWDFTNECIKVKFNEKYREEVCTKMHLISQFQNEYSQYPCAPKISLNRVVNNVKIIRMVKLRDFYKTTFWKKMQQRPKLQQRGCSPFLLSTWRQKHPFRLIVQPFSTEYEEK